MKFRPLHDRVVIRRLEGEEKTKGGSSFPTPPRKSRKRAKSLPLVLAGVTKQANSSPSISRQAIECCLANGRARK